MSSVFHKVRFYCDNFKGNCGCWLRGQCGICGKENAEMPQFRILNALWKKKT